MIRSRLALSLAPLAMLALAGACLAEGAPVAVSHKPVLTMSGAQAVLAAALEQAHKGAGTGAIAVVDDGGSLLLFARLDDTFPAGGEVAIGKARTAATFRKATKSFEEAIKSGRTPLLNAPGLTPLQGGVPIVLDGQIVGAIGVSGAASAEEDEVIALAGAGALAPASKEPTTTAHH